MSKVRYQTRPTKKLREVVDSDLLTATEKIIMGTQGGFYCMADEEAYFRVSGEKSSMSINEFEKKLRNELHVNFFVVFNPKVTKDNKVEGHQIGFYVPEYKGFVPLCKVGRSGSKDIPANSQGGMTKKDDGGEVAIVYRGYVAAFEAAKAFINDAQIYGIKPSRTIDAKDFFTYKRVVEEIGGATKLHEAFEDGRKLQEVEEAKLAFDEAAKLALDEELAAERITERITEAAENFVIDQVLPKMEDKDAL